MDHPSLLVEDLRKTYLRAHGGQLEAVRGVSFQVPAGECFGLLGPNGAGKSTSMKCITGFYQPTSGKVLLNGIDVHRHPKRARARLGVCSQEDTLDTDFSVLDQMVQFGAYFGIARVAATSKAKDLLDRFGISSKKEDRVESLSGGMRRRLQVARALMNDPKILVLDEPTTGLDPEARRTLWEILVNERKNGMAILLSTHYMEEAERLCDRVAIIHRGEILSCDSPQALITQHIGTESVEEELRPGVKIRRAPNLEDVYLKLTGARLDVGNSEEGESG